MNFHFSAFKFIELLSNGSLKRREAREHAEEADGKLLTFYCISNNLYFSLANPYKMNSFIGRKKHHLRYPLVPAKTPPTLQSKLQMRLRGTLPRASSSSSLHRAVSAAHRERMYTPGLPSTHLNVSLPSSLGKQSKLVAGPAMNS